MFSKLKGDICNKKILAFMIGNRNTQHMNNVQTIFKKKNGYEKQMTELGFKIEGLSIEEKMAMLKAHRIDQYEKLTDAVYKRRGWNENGVPTIEKLKEMKMDLPELIEIVERHL